MKVFMAIVLVLVLAASACAWETKAYVMRDDFGTQPLYDCYMSYYYYIPCPTSSWFWYFTGWGAGDIVGVFFTVGDVSTWSGTACDPLNCFTLEQIRILDFAGYGTVYPGWFSVTFDVYCSDEQGCPIGPSIHTSYAVDTGFAWNYIQVDPPLCLDACAIDKGPPPSGPRFLVTATHTGSVGSYPAWGADNISSALQEQCALHDYGCMAVLYPRPYTSYYNTMHSGYYGNGAMTYCPPLWFCDGRDTSIDCDVYGFIELAWRAYFLCQGPTGTEPSTWGNIKSIYK